VLARLPRVIPLLSYNKFYFDEIYDRALVQPVKAVARTARRVVEPDVMDSWVEGIGDLLRGFSLDLRTVQTGLIRDYASIFTVFAVVLVVVWVFIAR
jgi:NADH-quinone oxidoreductase subunit L